MKLDSARELKLQVTSSLLRIRPSRRSEIGAFAIPARRAIEVDPIQRSLAVGIHLHSRGNYRLAVRVQRRSLEDTSYVESIHRTAKGEVDVRYIGHVAKQASSFYQSRHRPLLIGTSIGHYAITAGTLGSFVKRRDNGAILILSNNHVLADENRGKRRDAIIQPGSYDGGHQGSDQVGSLDSFVKLQKTAANRVDCAIAAIREGIQYQVGRLRNVGTLTGLAEDPEAYELVEKLGRTTGHTRGRVTAFELDGVTVGYDLGNLRFDNQIEIEGAGSGPFSLGGDSGSLIFSSGDYAGVALLFAGSDQGGSNGKGLTYANPLTTVLRRLRCELLT